MDRPGTTAIVLAGGRSTRFGRPKLAAEVDGEPLLHRSIRAVAAIADEIVVVGGSIPLPTAGAIGVRSIRAIPDDEPFAGPLAALAVALRGTTTPFAIVVAGDMPGLVPIVLESMLGHLEANHDLDAAILASPAAVPARRQVLPLAVRVEIVSATASETVQAGERSLVRLLERLRCVEIPASEWLALDPAGRTLLDVDRPEDLDRIHQNFR